LSNQLINLHNVKSKHGQIKGNSNQKQNHGDTKRKHSVANFNINPFANKLFIILFTIFSIVLQTGIQPQLQANFVFAELNSQSIDDENEDTVNDENSYSTSTESKPKMIQKDPFGSSASGSASTSVTTNKDGSSSISESTSSASASASTSVSASSSGKVYGDFNGDGFDDVAIGVPNESVGSIANAGGVEVIYGSSSGLSATSPRADQFWTQDSANIEDSAEPDDRFGASLASGDFNGDGKDDLAIGVPDEDVGSKVNAGGVEVIYGSSGGLSATSPLGDQFWTQDSPDINDHTDKDDSFGYSVASGDFNGDGKDDLAIGVPLESVGTIDLAGGVEVIYGSSSGLSATAPKADQFWTQDSTNIEDVAETGDTFGFNSLASGDFNGDGKDDLAIGVSNEGVGSEGLEGAVEVIYGSSSGLSATSPLADQFWTQDSPDINDHADHSDAFGWSLASGDFNGDGKDDLAIGVEDEGLGSIPNAGGVEVIYGSSSGLSATSPRADQFWTQDSTNIDDVAEDGDNFGGSLTSGDFNGDGKDDLAVGVPNEDVGSIVDAGAVEVIYGSSGGLSATSPLPDQFWMQGNSKVENSPETNDQFGVSLTSADFNKDGRDDLAVGIPGEGIGSILSAGGVEVIYGSSGGLSTTSPLPDQLWTQDSTDINDHADQNDFFGSSLG